jgi:hypothetical protein
MIRTPAQLSLSRTAAEILGAPPPRAWYSEQRGTTGWTRQITPEPPHGAREVDEVQAVRSIAGSRVHLRHVRRVPYHMAGARIDEIAAALFDG